MLKIDLKIGLIIITLLLFFGCGTYYKFYCVSNTMGSAINQELYYNQDCRVAVAHYSKGIDHAWAECKIDGKYQPVTIINETIEVDSSVTLGLTPYKYYYNIIQWLEKVYKESGHEAWIKKGEGKNVHFRF